MENLELWKKVEKTNPKYTKKAKIGGLEITSIAPQYQIMNVTEQFGSYGKSWGFKKIELDYSLVSTPCLKDKTEGSYPNVKVIGKEDSIMGLVIFKAIFFYPDGEFPIINSISLFTNNDKTKIDDNFAKKVETDSLTKAISKLGFNADIFLGKFNDVKYVNEIKMEFNESNSLLEDSILLKISKCTTIQELTEINQQYPKNDIVKNALTERKNQIQKL